jgi:PAS domain S-box-containing protein
MEKVLYFREQLAAHGSVRDFEVELCAKSGEILIVLLQADMVEIGGEPHIVAAGVDITARHRAQAELQRTHERLRQSEELFSKAFRANPALVTITRLADGTLVGINEAFLRATGYIEAEVLGRTSNDLGLHAAPGQRERFVGEITARGSIREIEFMIRTKGGDVRTLLVSGERTDIDGTPHVLTVGLDITERKRADAKLRENELKLRENEARISTAFHASPALMTIARLSDGGYVEVNDAFVRWLGVERERILGRSWQDFAMWEDLAAGERFFAELMRTRSVRNVECPLRRRDGENCILQVSADIIEINREPHILGFALDITQRKRAEAEQQQALAKERELSQLKTDFVSLVSHEFRTPLEVIMSSVDNLDRYHDRLPAGRRHELLRTINKSVRRMAGMMEEVLFLGRLDSERAEFKPAGLDLATLCQRVCDEMQSATNGRCPIALHIDGGLAGACGDEAVLRHILTNLLSNAVKYSEPGQPAELVVRREYDTAVFDVIDHGRGIPLADQKRLFEAFHRGSNVRQVPGTGLGLLIVRRCVELHGGTIRFESVEGRGTTFMVRLPLFAAAP